MNRHTLLLAVALAVATACSADPTGNAGPEPSSPGPGPSGPLPEPDPAPGPGPTPLPPPEQGTHFLQLSTTAPALAQTTVSFYAVRGEDREGILWYRRQDGQADSTRLARLRIDKESLLGDADGNPIAQGDSILITMTVVDPDRQIVEMEPSGLVFNPDKQADLTLCFYWADHDFNHDGSRDSQDEAIRSSLAIWAQEQTDEPYARLNNSHTSDSGDEIEAELPGFTRYVVAY